jgi:hypothetical protein
VRFQLLILSRCSRGSTHTLVGVSSDNVEVELTLFSFFRVIIDITLRKERGFLICLVYFNKRVYLQIRSLENADNELSSAKSR